jgi:hypothetical protein
MAQTISRLAPAPVAQPTVGRSWAALVTAIACWSLSPFLIFECAGLAKAPIVGLYAVALGSLSVFIASTLSRAYSPVAVLSRNRMDGSVKRGILLGAGAFVAYPLLYFSALQGAQSIVLVNLTNYLWPIVGMVVIGATVRGERSLEMVLALAFGFAGAALAIATAHPGSKHGADQFRPFILAGIGAIVYGSVSAYMRLYDKRHGQAQTAHLLLLALFAGGTVTWLSIGFLAVDHPAWIVVHGSLRRDTALLTYALLLPVAHLSWLTAVRNPRVPSFPAAYVIPVAGTAVLALAVGGHPPPATLSALVLVLCGVAFANSGRTAIPVGFAVTLSFLASIQLSQGLMGKIHGEVDAEIGQILLILVGLVAIFGGFVLTNAIHRYDTLQHCCASFYGKLAGDHALPPDVRTSALDRLDALVLEADGSQLAVAEEPASHEALTIDAANILELPLADVPDEALQARRLFPEEWANVDVALANRVSGYEWLVLLLGSAGLVTGLHLYAVNSKSAATILVRAFTIALIAGVVFTIRDYDRHRPERMVTVLRELRRGFGLAVDQGCPLALARQQQDRGGIAPWELVGLVILIGAALLAIAVNI